MRASFHYIYYSECNEPSGIIVYNLISVISEIGLHQVYILQFLAGPENVKSQLELSAHKQMVYP